MLKKTLELNDIEIDDGGKFINELESFKLVKINGNNITFTGVGQVKNYDVLKKDEGEEEKTFDLRDIQIFKVRYMPVRLESEVRAPSCVPVYRIDIDLKTGTNPSDKYSKYKTFWISPTIPGVYGSYDGIKNQVWNKFIYAPWDKSNGSKNRVGG